PASGSMKPLQSPTPPLAGFQAADRMEAVYHVGGCHDGHEEIHQRHAEEQCDDDPCHENLAQMPSPKRPDLPRHQAPDRSNFEVFAAEKIAVEAIEYKEIKRRQEEQYQVEWQK